MSHWKASRWSSLSLPRGARTARTKRRASTKSMPQYGDRVHIVSISATPFGKDYPAKSKIVPEPRITMDDLRWFQEEYNVTYPLLFDPSIQVATAYQIRSFPTTYLLDSEHRVVEVFEGGRPVADFQRVLDSILDGQ